KQVRLHDTTTGKLLVLLERVKSQGRLKDVSPGFRWGIFSPDRKGLLLGTEDPLNCPACIYHTDTGKLLGRVAFRKLRRLPTFSPCGKLLSWEAAGGTVQLVEIPIAKEQRVLGRSRVDQPEDEEPSPQLLAFSPDGGYVASDSGARLDVP